MARFDYIYTNFSAGEISPLLEGRIDLDKYTSGVKVAENYRVTPHGPAIGRGGSRYIGEAKYAYDTYPTRTIPFIASSEGQFILELGHNYIRFYTEHGQLVGDVGHPPDGLPWELASSIDSAHLAGFNYAQDADTLYLVHNLYAPLQLVRTDTYAWVLSAVSFTGTPAEWVAGNYPGAIGFYEQRMYLGGTVDQPMTLWGSKSADFTDMTIGAEADDAFKYTVAADRKSKILWFDYGETLAMGTQGAEYKVMSTGLNEAISPTNIKIVRQTNYGSANLMPIRISNELLYVQKGGKKIRSFQYSIDSDAHVSKDVTILSEHITKTKIVETAYQNEPDSIWWGVRTDGELVGLCYEPDLEVAGWFRYKLASGLIRSVAVIDGYWDIAHDEVWCLVDRIIDGSPVTYMEIIEPSLKPEEDLEDSFYVDCGLSTVSGELPATVIAGLDHLEGETVKVLVDGWVHPNCVVSGGQITLTEEAQSQVHAGLGFISHLRTLRPEGGNPIGTSQGKTKRISKSTVRIHRSLGLRIGESADEYDEYFFGPPTGMGEAVPLFSGDIELDVDADYSKDAELSITQSEPLPSTIICIMPTLRTQ